MGRLIFNLAVFSILALGGLSQALAGRDGKEIDALDILELIENNGGYAFAAAAADADIARARLAQARAAATGPAIEAATLDVGAAEQALVSSRNMVMLEGLSLFYGLHASEMQLRAISEEHASAYVRWDRSKEQLGLGRASPLEVAKILAQVEKSRLGVFRERSRNNTYRIRLQALIAEPLPGELISPPPPPAKAPPAVDRDLFADAVIEANPQIAALKKQKEANRIRRLAFDGDETRKNLLAAGERRLDALLQVSKQRLRLQAHSALMDRDNAYQRVISAMAGMDYARKTLFRRQQLYAQERITNLGQAMVDNSMAEAELIRASGAYYIEKARIAVLLGLNPAKGLDDGLLTSVLGVEATPSESFVPKGGSGFGQEDQDKVNRNIEK